MGDLQKGGSFAIIPAYNEETAIGSVVLKAKNYVDKVVVVNDGSTDATSEVARLAGATVIEHKKNGGYGAALQSCFQQGKKFDVNVMIVFDSDGQHDPSHIPLFIDKINEGADVVVGSRFLNDNGNGKIPAYRKFGMKVLDTATNAASGLDVSDTQSGYRAYSKDAVNKILINSSGMSAGSEILISAKKNKLKIVEVPIECKYDVDNPSTYNPVRHGMNVLMGIAKTFIIDRPLFYFGIPGVSMLFSGFICATLLIQSYNLGGNLPFGPSVLMLLLVISGLLTTFTGLMLHSLSRLKKEISIRKKVF